MLLGRQSGLVNNFQMSSYFAAGRIGGRVIQANMGADRMQPCLKTLELLVVGK
jgi:hypothetical protein